MKEEIMKTSTKVTFEIQNEEDLDLFVSLLKADILQKHVEIQHDRAFCDTYPSLSSLSEKIIDIVSDVLDTIGLSEEAEK